LSSASIPKNGFQVLKNTAVIPTGRVAGHVDFFGRLPFGDVCWTYIEIVEVRSNSVENSSAKLEPKQRCRLGVKVAASLKLVSPEYT
jgi:hypothetical protein